jgi:type IV fimbrial biogenesis protein FimT
MKNRSHGFTLTELMVVLAVAAAILVIGVPAFNNFRENGRLTNAANDMLSATVLARTEAIKRQATVSLCPSANPTADEPTCTADSTVGWIVFLDGDRSCTRATGGTEDLISGRKFDNSIITNALRVKYDGDCLAFAPTGFRQDISGKTALKHVLMCDNRGTDKQKGLDVSAARGLVITPTGRAHITRLVSGGLADDISTWGEAGVCR